MRDRWNNLIDTFVIDEEKFVSLIDNFNYSIDNYDYISIKEIVNDIQSKIESESLKKFYKPLLTKEECLDIVAIIVESIYNKNFELDNFLIKNFFTSYGLKIYSNLAELGNIFDDSSFWSKAERILDTIDFFKTISELLPSADSHIKYYLIDKIGKIKTARTQYIIFPYLRNSDTKIKKKAITSLKGFSDYSTVEALVKIISKDELCLGSIRNVLSYIAKKNIEIIIKFIEGPLSYFQKKILIDIIMENKSFLVISFLYKLLDSDHEKVKIYVGKKLGIYFNDIILEKTQAKSDSQKQIFYEKYRPVAQLAVNYIGYSEISSSVLTKFIFAFEEIYDLHEIFKKMTDSVKYNFLEMLIRLERLDIIVNISDDICSLSNEKELDKILEYLKNKLNQGSIEALIHFMVSENDYLSEKSEQFLKDKNLISMYSKYVDDFNSKVRLGAIKLLKHTKNHVNYKKISNRIKDPDYKVRAEVVKALYEINISKAFDVIKEYIRDSSIEVVRTAVELLQNYNNNEALSLFLELMYYPEKSIKIIAANCTVKRVYDLDENSEFFNSNKLDKILKKAAEIDINIFDFLNKELESTVRENRLKSIKFIKYFLNIDIFHLYQEKLLKLLKDPVFDVVRNTVGAFCVINTPEDFIPVLELLKNPYRFEILDEIIMAAEKVRNFLGKSFVDIIEEYYYSNENLPQIKAYIKVILIRLGYSESFKDIINMILSDSYIERSSAIEAFGSIASGDKLKIVFSALQDSSSEVRLSSLKVLNKIKRSKNGYIIFQNEKYINPLLNDNDSRIKELAKEVLLR